MNKDYFDKYVDKLLSIPNDFSVEREKKFLSYKTLDEISKYYYKKLVNPRSLKKGVPAFSFLETPYENLEGMELNDAIVKTGNLVRYLEIKKGLTFTDEYLDILPLIAERMAYYDLAFRCSDENIKWEAMAFQINRARKEALNYKKNLSKHSKMVLVSTAFASTIDTRKINESFSKRVNRIILGKESLDDLVLDYGGVYNNPNVEMSLAYQVNSLKMRP